MCKDFSVSTIGQHTLVADQIHLQFDVPDGVITIMESACWTLLGHIMLMLQYCIVPVGEDQGKPVIILPSTHGHRQACHSHLHVVRVPDILLEWRTCKGSWTSFADSIRQAQIADHSSVICSQHDLHLCRNTLRTLFYGTAIMVLRLRTLMQHHEGLLFGWVPVDLTAFNL